MAMLAPCGCSKCDPCSQQNPKCNHPNLPVVPNACGWYGEIIQVSAGSGAILSNVYVGADGGTSGSYAAGSGILVPIRVLVRGPGGGLVSELIWIDPTISYIALQKNIAYDNAAGYSGYGLGEFPTSYFAEDAIAQVLANAIC